MGVFIVTAAQLTLEEIRRTFPAPEFTEAAGVLEMISNSPEQRMQYDARRKLQLDEAARIEYARDEGLKKGREEGREEGELLGRQKGELLGRQKGELLGRVAILQELLSISQPSCEELSTYDMSQLSELAKQLQQQLSRRGP